MTPERRTSTSNNATSVVFLDTISYFHLIDYQRFWDGSCHSVAMAKMQVTRVICSGDSHQGLADNVHSNGLSAGRSRRQTNCDLLGNATNHD